MIGIKRERVRFQLRKRVVGGMNSIKSTTLVRNDKQNARLVDFVAEDVPAIHLGVEQTMYAIAFDLDSSVLRENYHNPSFENAHTDIRNCLPLHGFNWWQGSVYFGDVDKVNAVTCVMAVMDLTRTLPWFATDFTDI